MPKKANRKALLDLAIRRQVLLERIKAGQFKDLNKVIGEVQKLILAKVGALTQDLAGENRRFLNKWLGQIDSAILKEYKGGLKLFNLQLEEVAGVFAAMEAGDVASSITGTVKLKSPTPKQAFNLAKVQAMSHSGETLDQFVESLAGNETKRVVSMFRRGFYQGRTNQDLVRELVGTKANRFQDGLLSVSRRNAKTVVQTSIQHAASVGRMATWKANDELFTGYQWVSTLDSITSNKCKSLDGQEFKIDEGPLPPIHPNCRSTTIGVLSPEFDVLSEGRTRSAEFGPVGGKQGYYDWLKTQDAGFQEQALGPARSKLFREGGLSAKKFRDLQLDKNFDPLTLAEMRKLEPEAFKLAGL